MAVLLLIMPINTPSLIGLWERKVTFFSMDTSTIQGLGYKFNEGSLAHLPKQLPSWINIVFTRIVVEEIVSYQLGPFKKDLNCINSSLNSISRLLPDEVGDVIDLVSRSNFLSSAEILFSSRIDDYIGIYNGLILEFDEINPKSLFKDYFRMVPPFEDKKKSEFPDAASLQLLHCYAERNDSYGIVISADKGWRDFCDNSDRLYYVASVDDMAALYSTRSEYADKVKSHILSLIDDGDSYISRRIYDEVASNIDGAEWDYSNFSSSADQFDIETLEVRFDGQGLGDGMDIIGDVEVWSQNDDLNTWLIKFSVNVGVAILIGVSFNKWDSIDREYVCIGSCEDDIYQSVEVDVFLTCEHMSLDSDPESWDVEVSASGSGYVLDSYDLDVYMYMDDI